MNDYIAGAVGGVAGIIIGHPFDTTKIQMQTRTSGDHRIKTTADAFRNVRAEGMRKGLFRGLSFPVSTYALTNGCFFGAYNQTLESMMKYKHDHPDASPTAYQVFGAGALAGALQLTLACPVDVVKCTMQAQIPLAKLPTQVAGTIDGAPRKAVKAVYPLKYYTGPVQCLIDIIRTQGLMGIYKGYWTMFARDVPSFGLYLLAYEVGMDWLIDRGMESKCACMLSGGVAGCVSWLVCMPFDVVKSRLQTDHGGRYTGFFDCARKSVRHAGWRVLFRGTTITMARAFPVNAITFLVYSELQQSLDKVNPPSEPRRGTINGD